MKNTGYAALLLLSLAIQACSKNDKHVPAPYPGPDPASAPTHVPAAMTATRKWSGYEKDTTYYFGPGHYNAITDSVWALTKLSDSTVVLPFKFSSSSASILFQNYTLTFRGRDSTAQTDTFNNVQPLSPTQIANPKVVLVYYYAADSLTYSYDETQPTEAHNVIWARIHTHN